MPRSLSPCPSSPGIVGIALCDKIRVSKKSSSSRESAPGKSSDYEEQEKGGEGDENEDDEKAGLISNADPEVALGLPLNGKNEPEDEAEPSSEDASNNNNKEASGKKRVFGIVSAILVGLTGGSVLVPAQYEKHFQGVTFLPSFGLGAMIAGLWSIMIDSCIPRTVVIKSSRTQRSIKGLYTYVCMYL